jgi:hypothetical protein
MQRHLACPFGKRRHSLQICLALRFQNHSPFIKPEWS